MIIGSDNYLYNFTGKVVTVLRNNDLLMIKKDLQSCVGKKVVLTADKGRKRIVTKEGIVEATYPNLFIVRLDNNYGEGRRISYTYTDVLTGTVEITVKLESEEKIS